MDLSLERWEGATSSEREAIAHRLARSLPTAFAFERVRRYHMGDEHHHVALFRRGTSTFALIPGGPVILGYDPDRPWQPTSDELESWQGDYGDWFDANMTVQGCIAAVTLRPRRVEFPPFLIETFPREIMWEPIETDDPIVQEMIRDLGPYPTESKMDGTRVSRRYDGSILAERFIGCDLTHAELAEQLAAAGFRFPTSDEWEYACGAGAPTLFRWGDHLPDDWDLTGQPNAFGIVIAANSYNNELVAEIGMTRGGDGGEAACGGASDFICMLRYATAYFEGRSCKHDPTKPVISYTIGRRVLALP